MQIYTDPHSIWDPAPLPPLSIFARLQQLRLQLVTNKLLPHLAECNQLRVLQLRFCMKATVRSQSLCAIIAPNAATLEELCFSRNFDDRWQSKLASALTKCAGQWRVLAKCVRLRMFELPLDAALTHHLLDALAQAPVFQSLDLSLPAAPWRCNAQSTLLLSALSSLSWCSVRLFLPEKSSPATLRSITGLTKMLPPPGPAQLVQPPTSLTAALRRLRVFVKRAGYSDERCFILRKANEGDGRLEWQLEY
jgi:hypothetical protein